MPRPTTTARMIIITTTMIMIMITTRMIITITRITTIITTTATTITVTTTIMTDGEAFAELPLLLWLSPSFPVGAFAYSHGLEWAVEAGDVTNAATLRDWLDDLLSFGAPRNDAALFALSFRAAAARDKPAVASLNELAVALAGSAERRLETVAQGGAFLAAVRNAWSAPVFELIDEDHANPIAYPIAVALAAAGHDLPLESSLQAFVLSFVANLVSAAVRLGPIGQSDGQRVLAALLSTVKLVAKQSSHATLDNLGGCALRADIAAMKHETQYSRLFRS
jgi:urease accessory protein